MSNLQMISKAMAVPAAQTDVITEALRTIRQHFGMDIAYLSEFAGDKIVFRAVDSTSNVAFPEVNDTYPLSESYCKHVSAGELPELISDTHDFPVALSLPITHVLPVRAHISVPIERSDGSTFGMFCCLSPRPNQSLNARDLDLMRAFGRLAQTEIQRTLEVEAQKTQIEQTIVRTLSEEAFSILYQPIFRLATGEITGVEALCRFAPEPYRPPNLWFGDAARVDMGERLELAVIQSALAARARIPAGVSLSVNASPATVAGGHLADILAPYAARGVVVEVTEHSAVSDWAALYRGLSGLRDLGIKIAIDDAGTGFSGLQQMVRLRPDIIKLDRSLVDHVDDDQAKRSLCTAMVHYAQETRTELVAEGIERLPEAKTLSQLGVPLGQGFLLAKPMPLDAVTALCHGACPVS